MLSTVSINSESLSKSKLFSDIDYYRRSYTIREKSNDGQESIVRFVSPELDVYEKYRYPLLKNSTIRELLPKYYYRPDYVSFEEYGTTNYWALLLFINNIPNIESFVTDRIIVPNKSIVTSISLDAEKVRTDLEIVPLSIRELSNTTAMYSGKISTVSVDGSSIISPAAYNGKIPEVLLDGSKDDENVLQTPGDIDYRRDTFVLTMTDVLNRYVTLNHPAISESIKLIIPGKENYVYNKHYTLIKGTSNMFNRVTWDPRKLMGPGMMSIMKEKLSFDVTYVERFNL